MGRMLQETGLTAYVLLVCGAPGTAVAGVDVYGQVTVATDYLFRGVSQTMSGAALQGELGFEHENGWYGYAWASNVEFTEGSDPDDGAEVELNLGGGYSLALTDRLTATIGAAQYLYPNTEAGFNYDYLEWHGSLEIDATHDLTIGYTDNVFGSGSAGTFYSLGTGRQLAGDVGLRLELGYYDLQNVYNNSYGYAELAIFSVLQTVEWQLSYSATTDRAAEIFYESTIDDRVVLALSVPF